MDEAQTLSGEAPARVSVSYSGSRKEIRIEGSLTQVRKTVARYLQDYPYQGYGTEFGQPVFMVDGLWVAIGSMQQSCD